MKEDGTVKILFWRFGWAYPTMVEKSGWRKLIGQLWWRKFEKPLWVKTLK